MKIGKKEMYMLIVLAMVLVVALVFLFAIKPMMDKGTELKSELETKKTEQKARQDEIAKLNDILVKKAELEAAKEEQNNFFMPYNDNTLELELKVVKELLFSDKDGKEYNFKSAQLSNSLIPKKVEGSDVLYSVEFTMTIDEANSNGAKVGNFYNFKEAVGGSKFPSSLIISEYIEYYKTSQTIEKCPIKTATATVVIYMIKPVEVTEDAPVVAA